MSAREAMPRSLRAPSIRGPTPGNSVTGRERRAVRVVLSGSRGPGPGAALEVSDAIRPRTDVGTDDPAYLGLDLLDDGRHLPLAPAGPLVWDNLPVLDPQDWAHVERRPDQAPRPPHATALRQVFQRAHGEENVAAPDRGLRRPPHVFELPALIYLPKGLSQDQSRAHLRALGVEHLYRWPLNHPRRGHGGSMGTAELA